MPSRSRPVVATIATFVVAPMLLLTACAGRTVPEARVSAVPEAAPESAPELPPVPLVTGPLAIRVQYPSPNQAIQARDSTFILGSVGNGRATLVVNGAPVRVLPNGAFLAWLAVPPTTAPSYELVASLGGVSSRLTLPVRVPGPRPASPSRATIRPLSDSTARVLVSAPPGTSSVTLRGVAVRGSGPAGTARLARSVGDTTVWTATAPVSLLRGGSTAIVAGPSGDSAYVSIAPFPAVAVLAPPTYAVLGLVGAPAAGDSEPTVIARPVPGGTYKWFLFPGTVLPVTGASGGARRVQLDERLSVWVDSSLVREPRPFDAAVVWPPRRVANNPRVVASADWVDVIIPIGERPPFLVEEQGSTLVLTLYGTEANTDIIQYVANDTLVRNITWTQDSDERARYVIQLSRAPYGYLALWRGSSFVLRVRRPPVVDATRPLAGLTIAVDPGHPPIGSTGPTGLYEGVATLAIGERVQALLAARGARVVMTRTTPAPVALGDRPEIARRANAHALVSIHLNALPDGINPYLVNGTGTYFFHPQSEPLAREVQRGMVRRMGLRDLGVYYDNLAVARATWMPSVLCEGAFVIVPEQEAALRTPEFQQRYAEGVVDGLEAYFRALPTR